MFRAVDGTKHVASLDQNKNANNHTVNEANPQIYTVLPLLKRYTDLYYNTISYTEKELRKPSELAAQIFC